MKTAGVKFHLLFRKEIYLLSISQLNFQACRTKRCIQSLLWNKTTLILDRKY